MCFWPVFFHLMIFEIQLESTHCVCVSHYIEILKDMMVSFSCEPTEVDDNILPMRK